MPHIYIMPDLHLEHETANHLDHLALDGARYRLALSAATWTT